jgi:hypothetical protein
VVLPERTIDECADAQERSPKCRCAYCPADSDAFPMRLFVKNESGSAPICERCLATAMRGVRKHHLALIANSVLALLGAARATGPASPQGNSGKPQ